MLHNCNVSVDKEGESANLSRAGNRYFEENRKMMEKSVTLCKTFWDSLHRRDTDNPGIRCNYKYRQYEDATQTQRQETKEVVTLILEALNKNNNSIQAGVEAILCWGGDDIKNPSVEKSLATDVKAVIMELTNRNHCITLC